MKRLVFVLRKYLQNKRRHGREFMSFGFMLRLSYLLTCNPRFPLHIKRANFLQWSIVFHVFHVFLERMANAVANDGARQYALGRCTDAVVSFTRAISLGHLPSRATLACILIEGREGVAQNIAEAVRLVESVSHLCCDCEGMFAMCLRFRYFAQPSLERTYAKWQEIVKQSIAMAIRSARNGSNYGRCELAYHTYYGDYTSDKVEEAHKLYLLAAHRGLDVAQFHSGLLFYRRQNVPQNYSRAISYLHMAAAQGYIPAIQEIAVFYEKGRGMLKNAIDAQVWKLRAEKAI